MQHLPQIEREIIEAVLDAVVARGLIVSIHDGEEWALKASDDLPAIKAAIGATDETTLRFRDPSRFADGGRVRTVGSVLLIHGNGCDVLSGWSDNEAMTALLAPALAVASRAAQ